jgi:predicted transcriptional regulator
MREDTFLETSNPDDLSPIMEMTVQLVGAYVQKNSVPMSEFPALIETVHAKLKSLNGLTVEEPASTPEKLKPAVSIKKSVTPDYLISLEDENGTSPSSGTLESAAYPLMNIGPSGA